jgi:glycosyltransferase involved in cell wall biosynthesis
MYSNLVVLYQEPAPYFLENIEIFGSNKSFKIHLFHFPLNTDAPFNYRNYNNIILYDLSQFSIIGLKSKITQINPRAIFLTSWRNSKYLYSSFFFNGPVVLGIDNVWFGETKQKIFASFFKIFFKHFIDGLWVPGLRQKSFGIKVGFQELNIKLGAYCCELDRYNSIFESNNTHSKRLIFAGRYASEKGILELLKAFKNLAPADWELHCIGTGPLKDQIPEIKGVKHYGFVQPADLPNIMKEGGVFILPSKFEPWGVVVHEFAAAGFPMVLSDQVGSVEVFLEEGVNGYTFSWQKENDLENTLQKIMSLSKDQLLEMGKKSHEFAQRITPELWANTLMEIIEESANVRN